MTARAAVASVVVLLLAACAELPPPAPDGTCGNHVIDPGEDCDGFPVEEGTLCRPPGAALACTLACGLQSDGTSPGCPSLMRCGVDGTCRAPSGTFADGVPQLGPAFVDLLVGDLDGDRRDDVVGVGTSASIAMYFDGSGALAAARETEGTALVPAPSVLADISGDGVLDVVGPVTIGTIVALGGPERALAPLAYPALTIDATQATDLRLVSVEALPDNPGRELLAVATASGLTGIVIVALPFQIFTGLEGPASALAGDLVAANFDEDPSTSPCEEIALAFAGSTEVREWTSCKLAGGVFVWNAPAPPPRKISVPMGTITRGPIVLDVNGDGHLDLIVGGDGCAACAVQVAYGVGDGTFHSDPDAIPAASGDDTFSAVSGFDAFPLAIGDLNGDGRLDQVTATAVRVREGGTWVDRATNSGAAWTEATIADLNHDGIPDVLAGSSKTAGVDFYLGDGDGAGTLNHFPITTAAPVARFVVGDYDGDLVNDVALIEIGVAPGSDAMSILFGRATSAPEPPARMGLLPPIVQITRTSAADHRVVDGITDLLSLSLTEAGTTISAFQGRSDRLLRSPLALTYTEPMQVSTDPYAATGYAAGRFLDGGAGTHLAMIGGEVPAHVGDPFLDVHRPWLYRSLGGGVLDTDRAGVGDLLDPNIDWDHALPAAVDLDGGGVDAFVVLATTKGADAHGVAVIARAEVDPSGDPDQPTWRFVFGAPTPIDAVFTRRAPVEPGARTGRVRVVDLDGDDHPEVVAIATASEAGEPATPHVVILWNAANGALGPMTVVPNPRDRSGKAEDAIDFATLEIDGSPGPEVAVLTASGVSVASIAGHTTTVADAPVVEIAGQDLLAAGDVDGDGVEDLVAAGVAGVTVFRGRQAVSR